MTSADSGRSAPPQADRVDDRLLRAVSHDLRTPAGTILGAADLIERSPDLSGDVRRWVSMIRGASSTLLSMVDNLVWQADEHRGRLQLGSADWIDLVAALRNIVDTLALQRRCTSSDITVDASSPTIGLVTFPVPVDRMLHNLIQNACSASSGNVSINVTEQAAGIRLTIDDGSTGFDAARLAELSEPGCRGIDASGVGLGLGLPVAESIANALGATVTVSGTGCLFVDFPQIVPVPQRTVITLGLGHDPLGVRQMLRQQSVTELPVANLGTLGRVIRRGDTILAASETALDGWTPPPTTKVFRFPDAALAPSSDNTAEPDHSVLDAFAVFIHEVFE